MLIKCLKIGTSFYFSLNHVASAVNAVDCCIKSGRKVYFGAVGGEDEDGAGAVTGGGKVGAVGRGKNEVILFVNVMMNMLCLHVKC